MPDMTDRGTVRLVVIALIGFGALAIGCATAVMLRYGTASAPLTGPLWTLAGGAVTGVGALLARTSSAPPPGAVPPPTVVNVAPLPPGPSIVTPAPEPEAESPGATPPAITEPTEVPR